MGSLANRFSLSSEEPNGPTCISGPLQALAASSESHLIAPDQWCSTDAGERYECQNDWRVTG